jgi:glycosyltransferase involved in cell wall biosynthesis
MTHVFAISKIVHMTSVHPAQDVRIFHKECRALASAGYNVVLIAPHNRNEVVEGVAIVGIPNKQGRIKRMTRSVWRVYREALRQDAEIYHFHDPELIPVGLLLVARGKAVIYDIHEDLALDILHSKPYIPASLRRLLAWVTDGFERAASRRFAALIFATAAISQKFAEHNCKTVLVRNYPLRDQVQDNAAALWRDRDLSVAYVGGIMPERGLKQVVRAMDLLPKHSRIRVKIAGAFSPFSFREELVNLPGWNRVDELGMVDRPVLNLILNQVRAGIVTYLPQPNHLRAEPNKLFEYMAAGLPVIASDFPLWREIVERTNCGLLVDPRDPRAIMNAIEFLVTHPDESQGMGQRGLQAVQQWFHWGSEEQKLLRLYADLVGEKCAAKCSDTGSD